MVTRDGRTYALSFMPGVSAQDELTAIGYSNASTAQTGAPLSNPLTVSNTVAGSTLPAYWYVGIFLLLAIMAFATRHESMKDNPKIVGIGVLNIAAVGTMAALWILTLKLIFNKVHVAGLTDLVNAL